MCSGFRKKQSCKRSKRPQKKQNRANGFVEPAGSIRFGKETTISLPKKIWMLSHQTTRYIYPERADTFAGLTAKQSNLPALPTIHQIHRADIFTAIKTERQPVSLRTPQCIRFPVLFRQRQRNKSEKVTKSAPKN